MMTIRIWDHVLVYCGGRHEAIVRMPRVYRAVDYHGGGGRVLISAEARWFWRQDLPPAVEAWFREGMSPPGGGQPRTDEYLLDRLQRELGIKMRGGGRGVEVKGLVARREHVSAPLQGRVEIWSKWISGALSIDRLPCVAVRKTRWLRKYDTSGGQVIEVPLDAEERPTDSPQHIIERGCQFELVALTIGPDDNVWWSVGFEAFGELDTIEDSLHRTLVYVAPRAPALDDGLELSYPEWLAEFAR